MNVKTSTKTYVDRAGTSFITKDSGVKTMSSAEMQKLGAENIGDALNKIADPQWVDPSKKMRTVGGNNLDKDAFMKLMLTQMKHQDPTNPMQAHEMAAQLASFTSVEQLQNLNTTMDSLKKAQAPIQQFETLNLIGKAVAGDSAQLNRTKEDTDHTFQFKLYKEAETVNVKVKNQQGEMVREFALRNLKEGANSIDWNGENEKGFKQAPGEYQLEIAALDKQGQKVGVETQFEGVITGVNFSPEGPLLMVGNRTVKFSDVKKIVDPSLKNDDQKTKNILSQDLKNSSPLLQNKNTSPIAPEAAKNNLGEIAMARSMLNRVEKEAGQEIAP